MQADAMKCLVCQKSSQEVPLISLTFQGQEYQICPEHFPVLIHQPQRLAGILPGAEKLHGHSHEE